MYLLLTPLLSLALPFIKLESIQDTIPKAQHSEQIDEAIQVMELLPKMIPGEHDGKKVNVEFALPIIFEVE
ncbi:MAG: hypothetical protein KJO39_11515 [Bacteroidia bacterium]|nr:hypothetical protein [Bacteroidia bacterium]NNF31709.1 hypothetical protein [Flavobacteriaceae bacterium]NNJ83141.1 hypothetical protein [Flavobacteriaceae bacterium]NNK55223.1 hypothetical protein [Flavobacteriaceae bacterium]NNM10218.1 hypothetical protein [Flavobacteriaceae bacterium]